MDNINDIISSLSPEDMEMLKNVAGSILGGDTKESSPNNTNEGSIQNQFGISSDDFSMIMKAKSIFDRMNRTSSKNADLINALKPHLSEKSCERADQAIRILKLFEILPYIKDLF